MKSCCCCCCCCCCYGQLMAIFCSPFRYYTLPGSGKKAVKSLYSRSNINKPGKWMFRVGWPDMYGLNIQSADSYSTADQQNKPEKSTFFSSKCK